MAIFRIIKEDISQLNEVSKFNDDLINLKNLVIKTG